MNAAALRALFDALDDIQEALHVAHPELPLSEYALPDDTPSAFADVMLLFIDNLRAATHRYQREMHLKRFMTEASD